ncbi:hypothetical protein K493DRAFT_334739 [Basidiobolus meristosporus CBS 931.73]|uniref:UV-stimulated scaffold protein A C-terminal domain-containing protein n=1 Tax=Basidiobolus meristosporus CBS 931.73 TaxID=1314790 RepID=A0A1Y1YVY5_9FUNG|nr:hypothetical protein K493DRAFT_334739 [Basidiobolus meristosporus CBS 931.73]|eukprot:ORY02106.1 hypothetical protein K493DRAFT_334739 [Basidiobolus meristosporus CBS 931.73]
MDLEARNALSHLINSITTTGELRINEVKLKLKKRHAQVLNLSLFVLLAKLTYSVCRSHHFRLLLSEEFPIFLQYTIGIHGKDLPPPKESAHKLRELTLDHIKNWNLKFGDTYKQLALGCQYLKNHLQIDFSDRSTFTRNTLTDEKQERIKAARRKRFDTVKEEMDEQLINILENLKQMDSCFEILVPLYEGSNEDVPTSHTHANEPSIREIVHMHGLGSNRYKITIDLNRAKESLHIDENPENSAIYETLRESYKVLDHKHLNQVNTWISQLMKSESNNEQDRNDLLKKAINVRNALQTAKSKSQDLQIDKANHVVVNDDDDDESEVEFEEVPIFTQEGQPSTSSTTAEPTPTPIEEKKPDSKTINKVSRSVYHDTIFSLKNEVGLEEDPTMSRPRLGPIITDPPRKELNPVGAASSDSKENEKIQELLKRAPVIEYDTDLDYWEAKELPFNTTGLEYSHRFYGTSTGENCVSKDTLDRMKMRAVYYKPQPREIKACRAPMKSGKLCTRRDLVRCPFHGKVIPRDEYGRPSETQESPSVEEDKAETWEDLEEDIQNTLHLEHHQKGRRKKKRESGLIDIRTKPDTSRSRLQKKLADPKKRKIAEEVIANEDQMKLRNRKAFVWN